MTASPDLRSILLDLGVAGGEVDQAAAHGALELLALERVMLGEGGLLDVAEVSALTDVSLDQVRAYWRALGFPDPQPGEKLFSELDLELLRALSSFIDEGLLEPGLALQMARVVGSATSKIANAQVESTPLRPAGDGDDQAAVAAKGVEMLSVMPRVLEFAWRRHVAAAARRRIVRVTGGEGSEGVLVGFADLVGFTARTQQLAEDELAEVVGRFEEVAFDLVATHGGRVVKMIGDEVMFIHEDVRAGAELGIGLAARFRDDRMLSDVRVGLASGPVLERDGDVYGSVVNLANRLVAFAYPASVVVSEGVRDALEGDPRFVLRALGEQELKDIGRASIWVVRPVAPEGGAGSGHGFARAQAKRLHPGG